MECSKLYNFIAKIFSLIFRTDRKQNLKGIEELGIQKWAEEMSVSGKKIEIM
jgi:hypothetical protein